MLPDRDGLRRGVGVLAVAALAAALAGCVDTPAPAPTSSGSVSPSPTPTADPEFIPGGTAEENQPYFDFVNERLVAEDDDATGRAFIDNLVAAGFDKAAMEVTPDRTSIDLKADSVQFSVLVGDSCLVGQYGNVGYQSAVLPVLATGKCLVGVTRPIDW